MAFHVGQKVVCVDPDTGRGIWCRGEAPTKGDVYTVAGFGLTSDGAPSLYFREIQRGERTVKYYKYDPGYAAFRFRPAQERKTDISWAHKLVQPNAKSRKLVSS